MVLSGPVDVCLAIPRLSLDRPFTYLLDEGTGAGVGSLVTVAFHGRSVRGWILGPAADAPAGRLLPVRRVRSGVRFFDPQMLELLRWVAERYVAPLSTVIERSHPPRVAGEEGILEGDPPAAGPVTGATRHLPVLGRYGGDDILAPGTVWLRPLPGDEAAACVEAVGACVDAGRRALVLVPEVEPLPATAAATLDRFGDAAVLFAGDDPSQRYRTWLDIYRGRYAVVVGTRPAVFAPLRRLGLVWVSREVHPAHAEERAPYYHVRDVAIARARLARATCVLAALSPSVETAEASRAGTIPEARPPRHVERQAAPLVEVAAPEAEDRSARLGRLLGEAGSAALIVSRRGLGVARICRACGSHAACPACGGTIAVEAGAATCAVCRTPARCRSCGATAFGIERRGAEQVASWAARRTPVRVELERPGAPVPLPAAGTVVVGTAAAVKDVPSPGLDLVAILDPDRAVARPGVSAGERALATWMEAASWARPRAEGGRVLVQTRHPGHPAIQALVRWDPVPFLLAEARERARAGFPPGSAVFRVAGSATLPDELRRAGGDVVLTTPAGDGTVSLVAVRQQDVPAFSRAVRELARAGDVERVVAEPQR